VRRARGPGIALAVAIAVVLGGCEPVQSVPVWTTLPEFVLIDQDSQPYGTDQLRGRPWIADFIFTHCPGRCPMLTREMARIQTDLRGKGWDDVQLVSISVDPENDTPEVLAAYASKHGAQKGNWRFLTGQRDQIWSLGVDGFKLPIADTEDGFDGPILHSNKFVLTDRQGRIRGYYDALEKPARAKLLRDLEIVRAEPIANTP
jgi:protein SCO1/2